MNRPFSKREYSVSTFSTTCLPNEHTLVEQVMTILSLLSKLKINENINIRNFHIAFTEDLKYLLTTDTVKGSGIILEVGIEIGPKFHQEEGILRSLLVQLFKATGLLGEFVVDFFNIN